MRFRIRHSSTYRYSEPVFLEPQMLRLRPRCDAWQALHEFTLRTDPPPAGIGDFTDADGNCVARAWFDSLTDVLTITAESVVETRKENPFDFLADAGARLPMRYGPLEERLVRFVHPRFPDSAAGTMAHEVRSKANDDPLQFLFALNCEVAAAISTVVRDDGHPHPPDETWRLRAGACRDVAIFFIEACRHAGFAARFVSGYSEDSALAAEPHLHAWAEVYVPGGGWRGYDPSVGLVVADRHIALAASADPPGAAPVTGSFRGSAAEAAFTFDLSVHIEADANAA